MRAGFASEPSVSYLVNNADARVIEAFPTDDFLEMRVENLMLFEARLQLEEQLVEQLLNSGAVVEASEASALPLRSLNADERLAVVALAELATGAGRDQASQVDSLLARACLLSSHGCVVTLFKYWCLTSQYPGHPWASYREE
jgi:hypothetical protein